MNTPSSLVVRSEYVRRTFESDLISWQLSKAFLSLKDNGEIFNQKDFEELFEKSVKFWRYVIAYDCIKKWNLGTDFYLKLFYLCLSADEVWMASNCAISWNFPKECFITLLHRATYLWRRDLAEIIVKQGWLDVDLESLLLPPN